ncbi:MAG: sulfatase-like hydrolase/transferase [Pirellulaceae bacterium]|nr:sulfatase-like hydrolase/transferase [Pirellulaceae bacterium]
MFKHIVMCCLSLCILLMGLNEPGRTCCAEAVQSSQPNIVFIMADDLGWADVGFHGGNVATPNLDRLRGAGVELTQHYVAPVCSPTRTGLMTGRYWSRYGVTQPQATRALPFETVTLPKALKACGYQTCIAGKWHLGSLPQWGPQHFGFDHSYGSLGGGVGPYDHSYKRGIYQRTWHRNGQLIDESGHVTDLITREALQWIAGSGEAPFLLYVPFTAVHLPVKEPDEYLLRVPAAITERVARHYAASIIHLDEAVGKIMQAIQDKGQTQQTLIVFTSDNGASNAENHGQDYPPDDYPSGKLPGNNRPLRGKKGDGYEGGTRVPTLVAWPSVIPAGSVCHTPVHITDWMPTFCRLAGYSASAALNWDGADIWPAVVGRGDSDQFLTQRALYSVTPAFRALVLRVGDWKLIQFSDSDQEAERVELYNISNDPSETRNVATDYPEKRAELMHRLEQTSSSCSGCILQAISGMDNVVEAFLRMESVDQFANCVPEGLDGPGRLASNQPL